MSRHQRITRSVNYQQIATQSQQKSLKNLSIQQQALLSTSQVTNIHKHEQLSKQSQDSIGTIRKTHETTESQTEAEQQQKSPKEKQKNGKEKRSQKPSVSVQKKSQKCTQKTKKQKRSSKVIETIPCVFRLKQNSIKVKLRGDKFQIESEEQVLDIEELNFKQREEVLREFQQIFYQNCKKK